MSLTKSKKSTTKTGLGYSPLTEKIYYGKQNQDAQMWVGEKKDVTQDFIAVLFAYLEENTSRIISSGVEKNIFINLTFDKKGLEKGIKHLQKLLEKQK